MCIAVSVCLQPGSTVVNHEVHSGTKNIAEWQRATLAEEIKNQRFGLRSVTMACRCLRMRGGSRDDAVHRGSCDL
jgi:hypothetical protein